MAATLAFALFCTAIAVPRSAKRRVTASPSGAMMQVRPRGLHFVTTAGATPSRDAGCAVAWTLASLTKHAPRANATVWDASGAMNETLLRRHFARVVVRQGDPAKPIALREAASPDADAVWLDAGSALGARFNASWFQGRVEAAGGLLTLIARGVVGENTAGIPPEHPLCGSGLAALRHPASERQFEVWEAGLRKGAEALALATIAQGAPRNISCAFGPLFHGVALRLHTAPYHKARVRRWCNEEGIK